MSKCYYGAVFIAIVTVKRGLEALLWNSQLHSTMHHGTPYLLDYMPPSNKRPPPSSGAKLLRRVFISYIRVRLLVY